MSNEEIMTREQVPEKYRWNRESLFENDEAWEAAVSALEARLGQLGDLEQQLVAGPAELYETLELVHQLWSQVERPFIYASISLSVNTLDQTAAEQQGRMAGLASRFEAALAFVEPAILALGQETLDGWTAQEPRLERYRHHFADLFRKQAHVRSKEVEEVMGLSRDAAFSTYNTYNMLTSADFAFRPALTEDGRELPLTQGTLGKILAGTDRTARRTAWENYADTYLAHKNALASNLTTSIKQNVFASRVRRHPGTLQMALFRNNVPEEIFHNLIETFKAHLPTWQRYWRVRRKALGVDALQPYDIWAPLSQDPAHVSYEQAVEWICEGLAPLGEDYTSVMRRGCLEERWVDVFPTRGKREGAFSSGRQGTYPFIVTNFVEDAGSMGTLAHELGHSMHSYLSWQTQPAVYSGYSLFAAEVASNFHQAMLRAHLFSRQPSRELELAVLEEAMDNFHRYFLIMPTLARFELEMHRRVEQGGGLTADLMINTLADLYAEAHGDDMQMDRERVGINWATFGHLYADYYVFQYATGISAAHALANRVLSEGPAAAEDYRRFLSAGGSMYPIDALKMAGVDMSRPEPVVETFRVLEDLIDRIERLTG
jgi:oligoendopeptidase F